MTRRGPAKKTTEGATTGTPAGPRPLRVLLIEDNSTDAALLIRELRRGGYEPVARRVDTKASLYAALDEVWDIILCDYRMPGLDAPEALSIVRGRQVDTPCIIVSGTLGEEHAVLALRSGAQDFVLKDRLARLLPAVERELRDSETRIKHAIAATTLRATEASFRAAFELIPDGVVVCRDELVVHASRPAAAILGADSQDDLVGRSFVDMFAAADRESVRGWMGATRAATPVPFGELTMVRADGRVIYVETTVLSVVFEGEQAILGVIRDASPRRELVARTIQFDRMLAVGTLAAGVGHEINNPLTYVMANLGYAAKEVVRVQGKLEEFAEREPSVNAVAKALSKVATALTEASEGAERIRDITGDLNTLARNDEELVLVDLRAVADSALRMAAHELVHRARVVKQYDDVPPVSASKSRLGQVLLNLVVNAAHAVDNGAYDSNEIAVRIRSEGTSVVVEVRDTGCGISPEHRARLFTPFFTTKPVGRGTGLGLSISKRIVASLGGDIEIDSAPGRGTTARVRLPAAHGIPADAKSMSGSPPPHA